MPNTQTDQHAVFLLEEVFQLLRESLEHDPFNQSGYQPTKKHITRFRELLGQEFSFWLAESGNLFFSVLICAKKYADVAFTAHAVDHNESRKIYNLLLHTSQLIMSSGLQSEQTINSLLKLNALTDNQHATTQNVHEPVEHALAYLQSHVCELAIFNQP